MGVLRRRNLAGGQPLHRLAQVRQQSRNAAPGKCNHEDQHTAIDHEVEAGRIAGDELRRFAGGSHHKRPKQRAKDRAEPTDDGRQQRFDRDPRPVGNAGINKQKVLGIETSARRSDRGGWMFLCPVLSVC